MSHTDDILEGIFCQHCGVALPDGMAPGYPRSCEDCAGEVDWSIVREQQRVAKANRLETFINEVFPNSQWVSLTDFHFRYMVGNVRFDYWPSTMKVQWRGRVFHGIGPDSITGFIENRRDR